MCGICGFTGPADTPALNRMIESLRHRGPNGSGVWEGESISLGMTRLAIIDIKSGQQPVFNEEKTLCAVFNGEIYNHIELRRDLEKKGHKFYSDHADSEVIVHLYEEYGLDFLEKLNGMFAIALWDSRQKELILARDRIGIKPLYFSKTPSGVVFGSEPKAILSHPSVSREPNLIALHHYFTFKNVPSPLSAFKSIEQVRPGEFIRISSAGEVARRKWWQLDFREKESMDEEEAVWEVRRLLEDSVRLQMRSDVPIGAYLSGGVDSSSVVALMSRLGAKKLNTFTLVYDGGFPQKDEDRAMAMAVAKKYGTEHHECLITHQDLPEHIDSIVNAFDEPFSGVVSTYFITGLISEHVKVALSGDGADEIFGSYLSHRLAIPLSLYEAGGGEFSPDDTPWMVPYEGRQDELARILARGDEAERRMGLYIQDDDAKYALYSDDMSDALQGTRSSDLLRNILAECTTQDPLNRALCLDFMTLLPDQVLTFVDRLSMAHSVEVRPPFLDHRLVEYAATLPGRMKIRQGRVKHILKEAVKDLFPADIINRPKEGFIMPINEWILSSLRTYVEDTLSRQRLDRHKLLHAPSVAVLLKDHFSGKKNHGNRIWNLMMFQLWWEKYIRA
jgi:asparagine synthase (glutamine-hydrolysing)